MIETEVVRELAFPAERVWHYLSWRGIANIRGDAFFKGVSFEDDMNSVGSVRVLHLQDGTAVREVAEELDDRARRYAYRPLTLGSLPVENYRGSVAVHAIDPDCSIVTIRSCCDPVGISQDAWQEMYTSMENALLDLIERNLSDYTV